MSGPLGWDYPAGAEHDPRAPWNEEDAEPCDHCDGEGFVTCEDCDGAGMCDTCGERGYVQCPSCIGSGEGETPTERRMRLAEEKADRDLDLRKDRE
jgi:hypothetical protein